MASKSRQSNSRRSGGSQTAKKTAAAPKSSEGQNVSENPQDKQQGVSPTGMSDAIEERRNAENNFDADGYPTNVDKPKPDNWNDMSDDEKREYVYGDDNNSDDDSNDEDDAAKDQNPSEDDSEDDESEGGDGVEMASNEYLSSKGMLFGNGPNTVNPTNAGKKVDPPKGRILREGEETQFSGTIVGNMAVVDEDVYREVYPFRSKRPSYILVYVKGTAVPLNTLNALGINTDEAQAQSLIDADENEQGDDENDTKE